jgi:hypothetical protein
MKRVQSPRVVLGEFERGLFASLLVWFSLGQGLAQEQPRFSGLSLTNAAARLVLGLPASQRASWLSYTPSLTGAPWETLCVQRPAPGQTQAIFSVSLPAGAGSAFFSGHAATNYSPQELRMRVLCNGYFLTADPQRALSPSNTADRYRLYVLHALLVDPNTGRIAAIWPPFPGDFEDEPVVARPASECSALTNETPESFSLDTAALAEWWIRHDVSSNLFVGADVVDLKGAVVTPGLIDAHFHVTGWAKKVPDEGQQFGYFPDVSEPSYYASTNGVGRRRAREALAAIVQDANTYLTNGPGVALHGYLYSYIDDDPATGEALETHLFKPGAAGEWNEAYPLNGVGRTNGAAFESRPAVLVQTSGQSCWYNVALLERFNGAQTNVLAKRFPPAPLTAYAAPESGAEWAFDLGISQGADTNLYDIATPFDADLRLPLTPCGEPVLVPFSVTRVDADARRAWGTALLPDVAAQWALPAVGGAELIPFYRLIAPAITTQVWNEAASLSGGAAQSGTAYGSWDPRRPYASNWYSGAERGLLEYHFDPAANVWQPTGYAEHYVMRDLLVSVVTPALTVADHMRMRRNVARWCHRHGLTYAHDIMVYRRRSMLGEFQAYEALSYERDPAADPAFFEERKLDTSEQTGRFGLRVGQYYYVESMEEVDETLALAMDASGGYDRDRLGPPAGHADYPGWVKWLGWKLQLDGATASRNIFSSAPTAKPYSNEVYQTVDELGRPVVFYDHSFGLLTETSEQEQVLTSRETAALYWLVREDLQVDWSLFRAGVTEWLGHTVTTGVLATNLLLLEHVDLSVTNTAGEVAAFALAEKLSRLVLQVNDAYDRMLTSMAKIWYERSRADAATNPIPSQVVCHCTGDGAVDLYVRAIQQLKNEVANFPAEYGQLPTHWKAVIPSAEGLSVVRRAFSNERFRVEHAINLSPRAVAMIRHPSNGIDRATQPASRNVVFSSQPCVIALDGQGARTTSFVASQELWPIPGPSNFWKQVQPVPRFAHFHPGTLYQDYDIPYAIDTDPPSIRDPRPALTMIGAVSRCPFETDATNWLDRAGPVEAPFPRDYLADAVYAPFGIDYADRTNRLCLTCEQALCSMTFWNAYAGGTEREVGALASRRSDPGGGSGWLADFVVWTHNPLAIRSADGETLESLSRQYARLSPEQRKAVVNAFIEKFRPALTVVGGMPVYVAPGTEERWQGLLR